MTSKKPNTTQGRVTSDKRVAPTFRSACRAEALLYIRRGTGEGSLPHPVRRRLRFKYSSTLHS